MSMGKKKAASPKILFRPSREELIPRIEESKGGGGKKIDLLSSLSFTEKREGKACFTVPLDTGGKKRKKAHLLFQDAESQGGPMKSR